MHYQTVLRDGLAPVVSVLAAEVETAMPELIEATTHQILEQMPVYRDERFVTHAELRKSVRANLDYVMRTLRGEDVPDLSQARATGRARALQGAPLPEVLRAYRIGLTEVWHRFVLLTARGDHQDLAGLVAATSAVWALVDDYAEALTSSYRDTAAEVVVAHQNRRSALVEALFAGGAATEGTLWDIARVLELTVDGSFVVVAAETPRLGHEPLPKIEQRLREAQHASAWRLTPDLQVGVVSLRDPSACKVTIDLLREAPVGRVGMSPVFSGLGNTSRALHFARVALSSMAPGSTGLVQFTESPLAGLVASAPEASVQLAHHVLRPILDLPGDDRNVLLLTLRAWFDCQGSTKLTSERMFCHPNTIRHRLRRITDELGRSLTDPQDIAELGAALRALHLFPETSHLPAPRPTRAG
ncbi:MULTISPECIES: helix-turn-helix domain-containing protein [unclassified Amycolatopsis]|uniref:helix-turn-helix domain-containing protein n=1 Tax=unclassified Amycolatopsis TaxID=2618356 RepID=UPI001C6A1A47|nr:helix-turn-helix domain-containing protein [Amycolatopsis sp. DSM 110486]QYN20952.1 helix-turn-helix domain-containing protein [Amycolatopsis sp. DSM 110486]